MNNAIAEVIVDISADALDRTFDYIIPEQLAEEAEIGTPVIIPFGKGNRQIRGYITGIKDDSKWDKDKLKEIISVAKTDVPVEGQLLGLAAWMRSYYGSTMNEAIKTVLPVRARVKSVEEHWINLIIDSDKAQEFADACEEKHYVAKARLIRGLLEDETFTSTVAAQRYKTTKSVIESLVRDGIISVSDKRIDRTPTELLTDDTMGVPDGIRLTDEQQNAVDEFISDVDKGEANTYLLYGVTGSGKTEVYMSMLDHVIASGRQAIVLIPEIALTHQTVTRFAKRFGGRVTVIHSRMSQGERYDQFMRAKNHEVDIVIGPRSALFAPFDNLGLIIIDEEHEGSYSSEKTPCYHAIDVARQRAHMSEAPLVLGSATPSPDTYRAAMEGEYKLLTLTKRATGAPMPEVHVVDLREELKAKNHSVFSRLLTEKIKDRLEKHEQTMLFINRRGYAGFVSCRSCGYVVKCSHCDVSMTEHGRSAGKSKLVCHYCGTVEDMPKKCPECGSPYIASFGMGTEKVCELLESTFPGARVLRMDADTTKNKGGHERVLAPFREGEADILVGTQMIVKGHDLPRVTLVGAIAADLSLHMGDYESSMRTFELLMQAGGRAGRGEVPGEFVIQTYNPDSYCIRAVADNDPKLYYDNELAFRRTAGYPPYKSLLKILISSTEKSHAVTLANDIGETADRSGKDAVRIGPAPDIIPFIKDRHRMVIHVKSDDDDTITNIIKLIDGQTANDVRMRDTYISFYRHRCT